jgi:uncharacterized MAPEG superfamily protein
MSLSLWMLLAFAGWTVLVLVAGIGTRRLTLVFRGEAGMASFPADVPGGSHGYRRAMRAHANCVENLPIFGALVLTANAIGLRAPQIDVFAVVVVVARIVQSLIHMGFPERDGTVTARFTFFMVQLLAMLWIGVLIAAAAAHVPT